MHDAGGGWAREECQYGIRLPVMGVVDSTMVVEHDSRRKPFSGRSLRTESRAFASDVGVRS